ncbi:hypothetical protein SFRURICE_009045 [Spodoptera frugiperda]|nr:hypothetical protein SFRURICE_009045 [Spodoptera frugiperda]
MEVTASKRTQSRCREWERARRNKFNDAINKLGEIVKAIQKSNNPEDCEDVQYPKVEIVQKAIIYLNNFVQEKTQWKAEILALQVQLDTAKSKNSQTKDASTQVCINLIKKRKDSKYVKLCRLKKAKNKQEKPQIKISPPVETSTKLPILLPRSNKKGPENTIVVLPAAPYIFPQRPLLFPSVPPAIVLIDQNLQTLNKATVPIVNRNNGDITKTTMVNILPISAYSRPLSATKSKKSNVKLKNDISKKSTKKIKAVGTVKETPKTVEVKDNPVTSKESKITESPSNETKKNDKLVLSKDKKNESSKVITTDQQAKADNIQKDINTNMEKSDSKTNASDKVSSKTGDHEMPNNVDKPKCTETVTKEILTPAVASTSTAAITNTNNVPNTNETNKPNKILNEKEIIPESKESSKLPNILPLDTTLCDNVVDGGNARLELAEEFLATSPTAAFLMSFPLVSGNRADSPAEEHGHNTAQAITKDNNHKRTELVPPVVPYFEKPSNNDIKVKPVAKLPETCNTANKQNEPQKCVNVVTKESSNITSVTKSFNAVTMPNVSNENPFLNLSAPSIITTSCTLGDTTFGLDFDCNISKSMPSQSTGYASSNNFFYKGDPFSKSAIYSTSSITSTHEFNGLGLYPCAMEKYTSKNKPEFSGVDDNLMKIGSSRLTYDIDLGWSHKGLDFVNCPTTTNTFNKDTILTTTAAPYTSSYNPFNPDFHVPLVPNSNKKDNSNKPTSSFADTITSFYSQPANLWTEDAPFYTNSNMSKSLTSKNQNYTTFDPVHTNVNVKINTNKHYEPKVAEVSVESGIKTGNNVVTQHIPEKYTKKSPSKMHINWMTSETRSVQNNCNPIHPQTKEPHKATYNQIEHPVNKKQDHNEGNYFPISMHNFPPQVPQDEFQVWPSTRPLGTTEISIDPPPINLPTLVGDLALGPHDKNRKVDATNRGVPHSDIQNCGNFLSVTQLMNRSTDNMHSRYQIPNIDTSKTGSGKQNTNHFTNDNNRKTMPHLENHMSQPCYVFNDPKLVNTYESMTHSQFAPTKTKSNSKTEKSSKTQKNNNYSTEALLRGANATQKIQDNSAKFMMPPQKYTDFTTPQDSAVAQVSHFPPILDYSDNSYATQQFSGTTLYNTTTNTMSNSFYTNFMPGSSNLMSSNYASGPFTGDFIDYNQSAECNYGNHKYEELKMRNNPTMFQSEKVPPTYKSSRRESATKHKLECSKKESSKKYQSKKAKITNEVEEWNDPHLFWQNKTLNKKHPNLMAEELPFPNYVGNQMPSQYQADFFNSHLMPANVQGMGHNVDRSLASFPVTSRANFNLSTIFPEITMVSVSF